jgi:hypothetical protein
MPETAAQSFEIAWHRRRLEWRRQPENAPWLTEAILLGRTLIEGRPALRIVCRIASINEERIGEAAAQEAFWHATRARLGRLYRLSPRDRAAVEALLATRVPKPAPSPLQTPVLPGTHSIAGPHSPLTGLAERAWRSERAQSTT